MERVSKLKKLNDTRRLLRLCFTCLASASQVPLEVWRDNIVLETDLPTMTLLAQTCKAFWELVEEIRRCNVRVALVYRQYDQIPLARRCLKMCARNDVAEAMFHLGYAKMYGGFGFDYDECKINWIQQAALSGKSYIAMAVYAQCFKESDPSTFNYLMKQVLSSNDNLALGYYHYANSDFKKAFPFLEKSAKEGNEYGQYWFASVNKRERTYWLVRAAKQRFYNALVDINSCVPSIFWSEKIQQQSDRILDNYIRSVEKLIFNYQLRN